MVTYKTAQKNLVSIFSEVAGGDYANNVKKYQTFKERY